MKLDNAISWKLDRRQKLGLIAASLLWILLSGLAHYLTGPKYEFHILFLLPVVLVCWYVGVKAGIIAALLGAATWMAGLVCAAAYRRFPGVPGQSRSAQPSPSIWIIK